MSYPGARNRFLFYSSSTAVFILIILIWVCFCDCQAGAIRLFPLKHPHHQAHGILSNNNNNTYNDRDSFNDKKMKMSKQGELLFQKYFKGRFLRNFNFNTSSSQSYYHRHQGFQDDKRRVPSCPDPLHN